MYSNEPEGIRRAKTEYVEREMDEIAVEAITTPLYVGVEAMTSDEIEDRKAPQGKGPR